MKISTLLTPELSQIRRDGNTTRQIDFAVQQMFKGKTVAVHDHYMGGINRDANIRLADLIYKRMATEHKTFKLIVKRDKNTITIKLDG